MPYKRWLNWAKDINRTPCSKTIGIFFPPHAKKKCPCIFDTHGVLFPFTWKMKTSSATFIYASILMRRKNIFPHGKSSLGKRKRKYLLCHRYRESRKALLDCRCGKDWGETAAVAILLLVSVPYIIDDSQQNVRERRQMRFLESRRECRQVCFLKSQVIWAIVLGKGIVHQNASWDVLLVKGTFSEES